MGKLRKRRKFFKLFSCLGLRSESAVGGDRAALEETVSCSTPRISSQPSVLPLREKESASCPDDMFRYSSAGSVILPVPTSNANLFHVSDDCKKSADDHPPLAQQEDLTEEDRADTPVEVDGTIVVESRPSTEDQTASTDTSTQPPNATPTELTDHNAEAGDAETGAADNLPATEPVSGDEDAVVGCDEVVTAGNDGSTESAVDVDESPMVEREQTEAERVMAEFEGKTPAKRRGSDDGTAGTTDSGLGQSDNTENSALVGDPAMDGMTEEEKTIAKNLQKRGYVIMELIDTEKDYVKDLGLIVEGYMKIIQTQEVPMPSGMEGKDKIVFGNIHQIYDWHRETFQPELNRCADEPDRVGGVFVRYERRLYMYVKYCENKPKSEYIVAEYIDYFEELRQKMGHRLQLPDLLIKPIQRIMKYQLMLKDILKHSERAHQDTTDLQKALQVMKVVPKAANDMMNVGRLQGFDGKITAQGKLLLQDTLMIMEHQMVGGRPTKTDKQTMRERRVFLFEQIIIFSEEIDKRKNNLSSPGYIYKHSIKINNMTLDPKADGEPLRFLLIDKSPGSDFALLCQASSEDGKQNWISTLRSLLDMQGDFLRALQSPIAYQKELSKELSAPEFDSFPSQPAQHGCLLRKTNSQPHSTMHSTLPPVGKRSSGGSGGSGSNKKQDSLKYSRTTSVPMPLEGKPANVEKVKGEDGKSRTKSGSPQQPKRTIFSGLRSTLRPSSKSRSQEDLSRTESAVSSSLATGNGVTGGGGNTAGKAHSKDDGNEVDLNTEPPNSDFVFEVAPTFQQHLRDTYVVAVGCTATLLCKVCGRPRPTVEWSGPGRSKVIADHRTVLSYSEDGEAVLVLHGVSVDDAGEYTCSAVNDAGSAITRLALSIASDETVSSSCTRSNDHSHLSTADDRATDT